MANPCLCEARGVATVPDDLLPRGFEVAGLTIESVLGRGAFGITYRVHDRELGRTVALKEYFPRRLASRTAGGAVEPASNEAQPEFAWGLDRFLLEARTLARFTHLNIVAVHNILERNGTAYLVMAYVDGVSLEEAQKRNGRMAQSEIIRLIDSITDGLASVHACGVIHRDIKPANILLKDSLGPPVLVDFGSARETPGSVSVPLTTLVSPGYAPVEQYVSNALRQGPWTDIYALGATVYRCITGRPPPEATTRKASYLESARDTIIPAREAGRGRYSQAFLAAVDWALEVQPEKRPQTVGAWRHALRLAELSSITRPPAPAAALFPDQGSQCMHDAPTERRDSGAVPADRPATGEPSGYRPRLAMVLTMVACLWLIGALYGVRILASAPRAGHLLDARAARGDLVSVPAARRLPPDASSGSGRAALPTTAGASRRPAVVWAGRWVEAPAPELATALDDRLTRAPYEEVVKHEAAQ